MNLLLVGTYFINSLRFISLLVQSIIEIRNFSVGIHGLIDPEIVVRFLVGINSLLKSDQVCCGPQFVPCVFSR
jgi:hypothetical protein